jgi:hypothetical protein
MSGGTVNPGGLSGLGVYCAGLKGIDEVKGPTLIGFADFNFGGGFASSFSPSVSLSSPLQQTVSA